MSNDKLIMSVSELLDKIYGKYFLKDFFAKIVPGFSLMLVLLFIITGDISRIDMVKGFAWVFVLGFAWITAFGLQSIGEQFGLIKYYTDDYSNDKDWYKKLNEFFKKGTTEEKRGFERFIVISEATGNLSIFLLISIPLIVINSLSTNWNAICFCEFWLILAISVIFFVFLLRMHKIHVKRLCDYIEEVLSRNK